MRFQVCRASQRHNTTEAPCSVAMPWVRTYPNGEEEHYWTVEIKDFDALVTFIQEHGDIIMSIPERETYVNLTIYDGFVE